MKSVYETEQLLKLIMFRETIFCVQNILQVL